MPTAGFQAGLETTTTNMSYAPEATWATLPTTTFQSMRIISESMAHKKTRQRPGEIRGDRQAAPGLTTQEAASGTIVAPVFYSATGAASLFDDFLSSLVGSDWQAVTTIAGVGGDISLSSAGALTSTTAGKFTGLVAGQTVKLNGFTNAVNNGFAQIGSVISATSLQLIPLGFTPVTETPTGTAAKVTYSNLRNGLNFKSLYLQQRLDLAGTKWFRYPGSYVTRGQVSLSLGQFLQASFDVAAQQELKGTVDGSTGGIIAAPTTRVMDPVGGFKGVFWNGAAVQATVDQVSFDLSNDGAAPEYGLGTPIAAGMLGGTFTGSAKMRMYFRDFTYYDLFRAETAGALSIRMGDQTGNSYLATMPNVTLLLDSGVNADGPNKGLMADFTVEMNVDPVSACTFSIDRYSSAA